MKHPLPINEDLQIYEENQLISIQEKTRSNTIKYKQTFDMIQNHSTAIMHKEIFHFNFLTYKVHEINAV